MADRKYAMSKGTGPGDWLLLSNDGKTLWRIRKYEDGPSLGLEDWPNDKEVWGIWKWLGKIEPGAHIDLKDGGQWDFWEGTIETRALAVEGALRISDREAADA
jgi:hypothetical protein